MPDQVPKPSFVPAVPLLRRGNFPWALIVLLIAAFIIVLIAYFLFSRPETVPSAVLFEKLFPAGTPISELQKINIDIDGILQHPVFRTLQEHGPIPLQIPQAGKPNPFI
ncbi:MAG: hypothetical protein ACK4NX_00620 [Candidatus Paceibacteria bacterium]